MGKSLSGRFSLLVVASAGCDAVLATFEVIPSRVVRALEGESMGLSHLEPPSQYGYRSRRAVRIFLLSSHLSALPVTVDLAEWWTSKVSIFLPSADTPSITYPALQCRLNASECSAAQTSSSHQREMPCRRTLLRPVNA
jgi:hypothetical protein